MKIAFRRVTATASALAMTLGLLVATATPASADIRAVDAMSQTHTFTVGDAVNIDFGCQVTDQNTSVQTNWFTNGALPDGLVYTNGVVTGTVTTAGTFQISGFNCNYTDNGGSYSAGFGGWATATFIIAPPVSPAPNLWVTERNNASCEFRVMGMLPAQTAPGAASLNFSRLGSTWGPVVLNDPAPGSVFDLTVSALDLTTMTFSPNVTSVPGASGNWCNSQITATLTYNVAGSTAATSGAVFTPTQSDIPSPFPALSAIALNDPTCSVKVVGVLPRTPIPSTVALTIANSTDAYQLSLKDYAAGELIDMTIPMKNMLQWATSAYDVQEISSTSASSLCDSTVTLTLSYENLDGPASSQDVTVYPRTVQSEPTIFVSTVLDRACTIRITGNVPKHTDGDMVKFSARRPSGGWDLILKTIRPDQPLDVTIDLSDVEAVALNPGVDSVYAWGDPVECQHVGFSASVYYNGIAYGVYVQALNGHPQPACEPGTYGVVSNQSGVFTRSCLPAPNGTFVPDSNVLGSAFTCEPGTFADEMRSITCKNATPGHFASGWGNTNESACPVGTFAADARSSMCQPAPKGYYVATEGATSATKCPAGLTTELEGARSKNECYKQKFQTAKAIKTPTKLKFGGKFETAGRADAGLNLTAVATGSCTLTATTKTVKVNGKSVKQPRWVIKATKKAGNCKVTFSNEGDYTYKPFSVTKTIKVTKTGK